MPTAYLVGLRIHPDEADELQEIIVSRVQSNADDGMPALLHRDGVRSVTVCLGRGDDGPIRWWFVEIADDIASHCQDPARAVRESPLLAGNASKLLDQAAPLIFDPGGQDSPVMDHAVNYPALRLTAVRAGLPRSTTRLADTTRVSVAVAGSGGVDSACPMPNSSSRARV